MGSGAGSRLLTALSNCFERVRKRNNVVTFWNADASLRTVCACLPGIAGDAQSERGLGNSNQRFSKVKRHEEVILLSLRLVVIHGRAQLV